MVLVIRNKQWAIVTVISSLDYLLQVKNKVRHTALRQFRIRARHPAPELRRHPPLPCRLRRGQSGKQRKSCLL